VGYTQRALLLMRDARADGTHDNNGRALRLYIDFALDLFHGGDNCWTWVLPLRGALPGHAVMMFLERAANACGAFGTYSQIVAGLSVFHSRRDVVFPLSKSDLSLINEGVARRMGREGRLGRGPKTPLQLLFLVYTIRYLMEIVAPPSGDYEPSRAHTEALRDSTMIQDGFVGTMRPSEIIGVDDEHWDFGSPLLYDGATFLLLPWSKTDPRRNGAPLVMAGVTHSGITLRANRERYRAVITRRFGSNWKPSPLFPNRGTVFFPKLPYESSFLRPPEPMKDASRSLTKIIRTRVKAALTYAKQHWDSTITIPSDTELAGSSLRRGGATAMTNAGISEEVRMGHGRWLSIANRQYVELGIQLRLQPSAMM
jgi:hypothetical protein